MIADGLTTADRSSYLRHVLRKSLLHVVRHPDIEWVYVEEKRREADRKREYVMAHRRAKKGNQPSVVAPACEEG